MRICPHCGMSNSDINKWCESCGFELIVEDREVEHAPEGTSTAENNTTTAGFIGRMGKTHYVSGHTNEKAGDMQKHVSGFGIIGKMGSVAYETDIGEQVPEKPAPKEVVAHSSFLGSIGSKTYHTDLEIDERGTSSPDSKFFGRIGTVEYGDTRSITGEAARKIDVSSGLYGCMGALEYKTELEAPEEDTSAPSIVSDTAFWGSVGDVSYTGTTPHAKRIEPSPITAPGRRGKNKTKYLWVVGIASILMASVLIVIISGTLRSDNKIYPINSAISYRINSEIIDGNDLPLYIQYRNAILRSISYKVLEVNSYKQTAKVVFSYVDVPSLMEDYAYSVSSAEAYYQLCIDAISSGSADRIQITIEISYTGKNPGIRIEDTDAFLNVLTGGTLKETQKLMAGA